MALLDAEMPEEGILIFFDQLYCRQCPQRTLHRSILANGTDVSSPL